MDEKQRRRIDYLKNELAKLDRFARQGTYPRDTCLICGRTAKKTFSSLDVPELMQYLGGQLDLEQLAVIVRRALGGPGCFFAPKSGVSICSGKEQLP